MKRIILNLIIFISVSYNLHAEVTTNVVVNEVINLSTIEKSANCLVYTKDGRKFLVRKDSLKYKNLKKNKK